MKEFAMNATPANRPPVSTLLPLTLVRGRRIGLMGGSFNPPHIGHLHVAEEALRRLRLDEVWWLLARRNPLKPADIYADHVHRVAAIRAFVAHHPRFRVMDVEWRLATNYTVEVLKALAPVLSQGFCAWIMGADSFATLHHWRHWRDIARMIPIAVFDRPGHTFAALSSPAARALAAHRLPQQAASLLPECTPPAWTFLFIRRCPESSTRLRALTRRAKKLAPARRDNA